MHRFCIVIRFKLGGTRFASRARLRPLRFFFGTEGKPKVCIGMQPEEKPKKPGMVFAARLDETPGLLPSIPGSASHREREKAIMFNPFDDGGGLPPGSIPPEMLAKLTQTVNDLALQRAVPQLIAVWEQMALVLDHFGAVQLEVIAAMLEIGSDMGREGRGNVLRGAELLGLIRMADMDDYPEGLQCRTGCGNPECVAHQRCIVPGPTLAVFTKQIPEDRQSLAEELIPAMVQLTRRLDEITIEQCKNQADEPADGPVSFSVRAANDAGAVESLLRHIGGSQGLREA